MADDLKLLDVSNPKKLKGTLNRVITETAAANTAAFEAKEIANNAEQIAQTANSTAQKALERINEVVPGGAGGVSSVNGETGAVELTAEDVGAVSKTASIPLSTGGVSQGIIENGINQITYTTQDVDAEGNISNKKSMDLFPEGLNFNNFERPYINGTERMAYLSDLKNAGSGFDLSMLPKYTSFVKVDLSKATDLAGNITLKFVESSNFSIDWGDGAPMETFTEPTTEAMHQYEDAAFKGTIWFYNNWNGFGICDDSVKKTFTNVLYDENIKELPANTFENCTALASFDYKYMPVSDYARNDYFKIGSYAFANVYRLLGFDFSRAYIDGESAFYNAFYINRLDIKIRGTNINNTATNIFGGNMWLDYVRFEGRTISRNMFDGSSVKRIEIVPDSRSRVTINSGGLQEISKSIIIHPTETAPRLSSADMIVAETIMVSSNVLADTKKGTNWVNLAERIYPYGGQYSETVMLPVSGWLNKQQTVEVIGSTPEQRNVIEFMLVDTSGNTIEDTYGLTATQGITEMTFTCTTVPTEDIYVFVKSTLTNY